MLKNAKLISKILASICVLVLYCSFLPTFIKADETINITTDDESVIMTAMDLAKLYNNPTGNYQLGADIDLSGIDWMPVNFSGTLEGNGYAILNVNISKFADGVKTTYDGTLKGYDSCFAGFFGILENATISNLKILGINVNVNSENPCFAAGLAGYMNNSHIINCSVEGTIELTTSAPSFGIGGIVGFGNGSVEGSLADTTLICTDQNKEQKDEQFMGGVYGAGYIDVKDTTVHVQGFDSDHGYVHNGGIVGMYLFYPEGTEHHGYLLNNKVSGFIVFQEENEQGASLCGTYVGEIINHDFDSDDTFHEKINDADDFDGEEIFDYENNLMPCRCGENAYEDIVVESTETSNGYTEHKCKTCGYYYRESYKVVLNNPQPAPQVEPEDIVVPKPSGKKGAIILAIICGLIIAGVVVIFIFGIKGSKEKAKKKLAKDSKKKPQKQPEKKLKKEPEKKPQKLQENQPQRPQQRSQQRPPQRLQQRPPQRPQQSQTKRPQQRPQQSQTKRPQQRPPQKQVVTKPKRQHYDDY